MKSLVNAVVLIAALSSAAYADEAPQRHKKPVCCAPFSWTGIYVGGHTGWGSMEIFVPSAPGIDTPPSPTGGLWGGQIGANYQFARHWVVGAEIDGAFARIEDSHIRPEPSVPTHASRRHGQAEFADDGAGTARFRLGPYSTLCHRRLGVEHGRSDNVELEQRRSSAGKS